MLERLQRTYGIIIRDEYVYNPSIGKSQKQYCIITADGCPWEKGLTYKGLLNEVKQYGRTFLKIKHSVKFSKSF